ncbi:MAG: glycosyltransferase, partial [Bdellovibrionia bacterium]
MRVLLFHPTLLPPRDYGGVERVLLWLAQGLLERGHSVSVAALPGSQIPSGCQLIEVSRQPYSASELNARIPHGTDLIHFMSPLSQEVWEGLDFPAVLTVHGNAKPGERYPLNSVFLSADHAARHGASQFIFNGIDPSEFLWDPHAPRSDYLFLSKTQWSVKNLKGAMRMVHQAGGRLRIAGGNRPWGLRSW